MTWWGIALFVLFLALVAFSIWNNMADGRGNNVRNTRNRGISGERGDEYRDQ